MTEKYVKKQKEKFKQEEEKTKKALDELNSVQTEKRLLEQKIIDLKQQHQVLISESLEGASSQVTTLQEQLSKTDSELTELKAQVEKSDALIEDYQSQLEQRKQLLIDITDSRDKALVDILQLQQDQANFISTLHRLFGVEELEYSGSTLLAKIEEVMTNYEEDKRSLRSLIDEKERLSSLQEQYYQEKESIIIEKNQLQQKLEGSNQYKLEKRVKEIEEERNLMKSDYNIQIFIQFLIIGIFELFLCIQITSFVETIDQLKSKLSRYEPVAEDRKEEEEDDDPSFAKGKKEAPPSFLDQSKTSHINNNSKRDDATQRSGIFNSIASFFLTESELGGDTNKV